jgi:outer membrane protein
MRKRSFLLACGVAAALLGPVAQSENLLDVYQAAVKSDPLIREAEARRLAALEAKPQARALLLPQISINGQAYTAESDSESYFPQVNTTTGEVVSVGNRNSTDTDQYWSYTAQLTQTIFRWDQWQTLKRADSEVALAEANYRAAQQDLMCAFRSGISTCSQPRTRWPRPRRRCRRSAASWSSPRSASRSA